MRHKDMLMALVALGGTLLVAGEARACEHHRAADKAQTAPAPAKDVSKAPPEDALDVPHAARCQCGSAADCTCKKGTCECPRCKKPGREEPAPLEAEPPAMHEAPRDGLEA
ncbi:metallothionein [Archangium primigenium]|uniref:metallothionein n=1 Tax=Melittangium TaxID=44 RepID=UPI00195D764C|nr:metallothionein [Archangium primigenium]MBM7114878.1 metallothionein [Archangium primigenium]